MRTLLVALMFLPLAGCLDGGDHAPKEADATPSLAYATNDPFFDGAPYDPALLNLDALSKPVFDILPVEEVWVTASDGMAMHNAVYRPDTTEPVPVFINFSPYWGDTAETKGDNFAAFMIDHFVPRGYAVVLAAIRGTGHSEGCFEVASDRESLDLKEVAEHFAAEPWSSGAIGMGGKSYDSTSQNGMIAKFPTDVVKTVFHVSGITDMYRYTFYNGLPTRSTSGGWTTTYSTGQGANEGADSPEALQRASQDASCTENAETVSMPMMSHAAGFMNPYWQERDWTRSIGQSPWQGSIFFVHGFHDWNVQPAHILPWLDNVPPAIQVKAWLHQDRDNGGHVYPMRADWNLTMLRYLDQELKGIDTGFWAEPHKQLEGSDGLWRDQDVWPDKREETRFPIAGDGTLLADHQEPMRYSGGPTITVTATASGPDPVFSAKLWDEAADGTRTLRNEAVIRLIYLDNLDQPSPVTIGEAMTFTVPFYASDDVLEVGHKWVLTYQEEPSHSIADPVQMATLTVDASSAVVDMMILPASEGVVDPQPRETPCYAC